MLVLAQVLMPAICIARLAVRMYSFQTPAQWTNAGFGCSHDGVDCISVLNRGCYAATARERAGWLRDRRRPWGNGGQGGGRSHG